MKLVECGIRGVLLVEPESVVDGRGTFTTLFRAGVSSDLQPVIRQIALSTNVARGTLRGLHFQREPHPQAKLVCCTRGRIFDAVVDLRPRSETFKDSYTVELYPGGASLSIPHGCAHGFLTLSDDSDVLYHLSAPGVSASAGGVRWDEPALAIPWPVAPAVMSERDRTWPDYEWSAGL